MNEILLTIIYVLLLILIPISIFILFIIAIIRSCLIYLNIPLTYKHVPYNLSDETYKYFENKLIPNKEEIEYLYYDKYTNKDYTAKMIKISNHGLKNKKTLVMIHGIAGSSYSWSYSIPELNKEFSEIYLVNLPGNGISEGAENFLLNSSYEIVNDYFVNFIKSTFDYFKLNNVTLFAHSLGCMYTIKFLKDHSNLVKNVIFMAPPSLHPVISNYQHVITYLFKKSIPQTILKPLGSLGTYVLFHIFDIFTVDYNLYHDILKWNNGWSDTLFLKFIKEDKNNISIVHSQLQDLLTLPIPFSFIHGENDFIIPKESISRVLTILETNIPFYVIKNSYHNPGSRINTCIEFAKAIIKLSDNNQLLIEKDIEFAKKLDISYIITNFKCYYNINKNKTIMKDYFTYLENLYNSL